jgi:uncharacterized OsmC-like protein
MNATGFMIAKEMGFEIRSIKTKLEGSLNPLGYMGKSKDTRAGLGGIKVILDIDASASEETLKQWKEQVSARCPVSDNLFNSTPIEILINRTEVN